MFCRLKLPIFVQPATGNLLLTDPVRPDRKAVLIACLTIGLPDRHVAGCRRIENSDRAGKLVDPRQGQGPGSALTWARSCGMGTHRLIQHSSAGSYDIPEVLSRFCARKSPEGCPGGSPPAVAEFLPVRGARELNSGRLPPGWPGGQSRANHSRLTKGVRRT